MAAIRLSKLCKQFNVSLTTLTSYLKVIGYDVEANPNSKVDESCLNHISIRFAQDEELKKQSILVSQRFAERIANSPKIALPKPERKIITDYDVKMHRHKKKIAPLQEQGRLNVPIYASDKAPNNSTQTAKLDTGKHAVPTIKDINWDIFDDAQSDDTHNGVRPEWEISLEKAIKTIPAPIDEESRNKVLNLVNQWLDENSMLESVNSSAEVLPEDIVSHIQIGDKGFFERFFANINDLEIPKKRELVKNTLILESLTGGDFWYFVNTLLTINANIYRAPICEAVNKFLSVKKLRLKTDDEFNMASALLFRDTEKCHQAIPFFYPFRDNLPPVVRQNIMDATRFLSTIEDLELAFTILGSDIQEKLYLLSANESIAGQYLGFSSLLDYKKQFGKDAIEKIGFFYSYMNNLDGSSLVWRLINKLVLEDNSEMTDEEAKRLLNDGFTSFSHHILKAEIKKIKKEHTAEISEFVGKQVHFDFAGETQWNIFGGTDAGYGFILPKIWINHPMKKKEWYYATVVKAVKNPNLLVLSQKTIKAGDLQKASTVHIGEIAEARFSLNNDKLETSLLGHGSTRAILKNIPRNFDYKIKHKVKVINVFDVNKCEIKVIQ